MSADLNNKVWPGVNEFYTKMQYEGGVINYQEEYHRLKRDYEDLQYYKYIYVCGKYGQDYMGRFENWKTHYENILNVCGLNKGKEAVDAT